MKKIFLILIPIFLVSCASNSVKHEESEKKALAEITQIAEQCKNNIKTRHQKHWANCHSAGIPEKLEQFDESALKINAYLSDGATVTITKSNTTGKLTFTFAGATLPANNTVTIFDNNNATAKDLLGISGNQTSDVITLPNPFNLSGVEYVAIHSPQVAYNHGLESGARGAVSIMEIVSLTETPFGAVAYHETKDDELSEIIFTEPTNLSNISIVLRDKNGTKLELPDNFDCSIIIKVFFD